MKTPAHFSGPRSFRIYVLECALRDRLSYLESIRGAKGTEEQASETVKEIQAMKAEQNKIKRALAQARERATA